MAIKFLNDQLFPTDIFLVDVSAGRVGIGTTSPTQELHVAGNLRVTGAYYDSNNSSGTAGQVLSSTATGTDWVSAGAGTITGDAREGRIAFGSATADDITNDEDFTIVQTTNEKRIQIAGGVQVADMSVLAGASLAGSLRYRVALQTSYVDMCMQTGPGIYSWVNIVQNSWTI
ncbi:hypothetical protein N8035_02330 [Algibacter sp.]|nr:hypothetical protein [Algibacter sp.]